MTGKFISIEGIDGSGKTTQVGRLERTLRLRGFDVVATREPGGTPIGEELRDVFLSHQWDGFEELCLLMAMRRRHVKEKIRPSLEAGKWVICDRFWATTFAYQGYGRGLDLDMVMALNEEATDALCPDLTLVLDVPPSVGSGRIAHRQLDRMESLDGSFYERVREGFSSFFCRYDDVVIVDGNHTQDVVESEIWHFVEKLL